LPQLAAAAAAAPSSGVEQPAERRNLIAASSSADSRRADEAHSLHTRSIASAGVAVALSALLVLYTMRSGIRAYRARRSSKHAAACDDAPTTRTALQA